MIIYTFSEMKIIKTIALLLLCLGLLFSTTSCVVYHPKQAKHDNGKHLGWYKNSNNPHHPHSSNQGKAKGKHKK